MEKSDKEIAEEIFGPLENHQVERCMDTLSFKMAKLRYECGLLVHQIKKEIKKLTSKR